MKLTKSKLKQIIKEELNEVTPHNPDSKPGEEYRNKIQGFKNILDLAELKSVDIKLALIHSIMLSVEDVLNHTKDEETRLGVEDIIRELLGPAYLPVRV